MKKYEEVWRKYKVTWKKYEENIKKYEGIWKKLWRKYEGIWSVMKEIWKNFSKSQSLAWSSEYFQVPGIWRNMKNIWRIMKTILYEEIMMKFNYYILRRRKTMHSHIYSPFSYRYSNIQHSSANDTTNPLNPRSW